MLDGLSVPILIATACLAGFVQGYAGFGMGIVYMATLSFFIRRLEPVTVLAMLLFLTSTASFLATSRSRAPVRWAKVFTLLPPIAVGIPFGYWFLLRFGDQPVAKVCLGAFLVLFAVRGLAVARIRKPLPAWAAAPAGMLGGLLSGAFSTGGPPPVVYLYSQNADPRPMKSTVTTTLLGMTCLRTAVTLAAPLLAPAAGLAEGRRVGITAEVLKVAAWSLPLVIGMIYVGHRVSSRFGAAIFRKVVYGLIGASGAGLIVTTVAK